MPLCRNHNELFLKLTLNDATAEEVSRAMIVFDYEAWNDTGRRLRFSFIQREAIYLLRGLGDAQYTRAQTAEIMRVSVGELDRVEESAKARARELQAAPLAQVS